MAPSRGPDASVPVDGTVETLLSGWGRTAPTRAGVWAPRRAEEVAGRLDLIARQPGSRGVVARGLGRSYGDAAQNAGGTVVLATGLNRVLELDVEKGLLTAEAGVSLDTLLRVLVPLGWFPMVVPGTRYVTLGGAVASDIHGKFRHGTFSDYVHALSLVTPGRGVVRTGPDREPDVFWATTGGMGLTGVVTDVSMQLQPIESSRMLVDTERTTDVDDCMARMMANDNEYQYSVAWIDCLATGKHLGRSVLTRGNHATLDDLPPDDRTAPSVYSPRSLVPALPWVPGGLLNPLTVRAFNEVWFRKAPKFRQGELQGITGFFFPLDGVTAWNRIYGRRGFLQYQYVVPYGAEHVVRESLERFSRQKATSFLAVLKRFEHRGTGGMSFVTPGWTLALDIAADRPGLVELLDGLDELVAGAGGRVYLTKDSRLRPELLPAMYPELDQWREQRAALDPAHILHSDLDRRLGLSGPGRAR
jgi:decaprenylphospho-beta-D-ribofuranose 2-oxidase